MAACAALSSSIRAVLARPGVLGIEGELPHRGQLQRRGSLCGAAADAPGKVRCTRERDRRAARRACHIKVSIAPKAANTAPPALPPVRAGRRSTRTGAKQAGSLLGIFVQRRMLQAALWAPAPFEPLSSVSARM
eukprot:5859605-Pleurochrysis_carterae.AAC.4